MKTSHHLLVIAIFGSLLYTTAVVMAQPRSLSESFQQVETQAQNLGLNTQSEPKSILQEIIKDFLNIIGALALVVVVYGGFIYLTSAGDENRAAKGKKIILGAIIGLIIIGLSAVIVNLTIGLFSGGGGGSSTSSPAP